MVNMSLPSVHRDWIFLVLLDKISTMSEYSQFKEWSLLWEFMFLPVQPHAMSSHLVRDGKDFGWDVDSPQLSDKSLNPTSRLIALFLHAFPWMNYSPQLNIYRVTCNNLFGLHPWIKHFSTPKTQKSKYNAMNGYRLYPYNEMIPNEQFCITIL
jgi:hypothetical protein